MQYDFHCSNKENEMQKLVVTLDYRSLLDILVVLSL